MAINQHLTCLQLNLDRSKAATAVLCQDLHQNKADLAFLQEPYIWEGRMMGVPLYWNPVHLKTSECRAAFLISSNLDFQIQTISPNVVSITVHLAWRTFLFICCYAPPSEPIDTLLHDLEAELASSPYPVIIAGDFNASHPLWGSPNSNARGVAVLQFLAANSLQVINSDESPPTFLTVNGRSWIDLSICSEAIADLVHDWEVSDNITQSDHQLLSFAIHPSKSHPISTLSTQGRPRRFNLHSADWEKFGHQFLHNPHIQGLRETPECLGAEEFASEITAGLTDACSAALRRSRPRTAPSNPWWTRDLAIQRKRVRALRRRAQRQRDPNQRAQLKALFQQEQAAYKREILRSKLESWKNFCTSTQNPFDLPYQIATDKVFRPTEIHSLQKSDSTTTHSIHETLDFLLQTLFPHDASPVAHVVSSRPSPNDPPFSQSEIQGVISSLPRGKAPGKDLLNLEILQRAFYHDPTVFVNLFNKCLEEGTFPDIWKEAVLVLFHKKNKDPRTPSAYRPICLLPSLGKILEKLIQQRLTYFLEKRNFFSDRQFGFRAGRSTSDALQCVLAQVTSNREHNLHTSLISLDIQQAFESVQWAPVIQILSNLQCPHNLLRLMESYLSSRKVTLQTHTLSLHRSIMQGCPQGSCLGPLLWNIYFNEVLKLSLPDGTSIQAFADDLLVVVQGTSREDLQRRGNGALELLRAWSVSRSLRFNLSKSAALTISPSRRYITRKPIFKLNNANIKHCTTLTYLGVTLDERLTFLPHLRSIKDRIESIVFRLARMAKSFWGLTGSLLKEIYKGSLERMVLYASPIWFKDNTQQKRLLSSIQRLPLLKCCRAFRTTSTAALQVISGCPPLALVARAENLLFESKRSGLAPQLDGIPQGPIETPLPKFSRHPTEGLSITFKDITETPNNIDIAIYTDGSKEGDRAGFAFCAFTQGSCFFSKQLRTGSSATVFQLEALALKYAVLWALENFHDGLQSLGFISDSRSVLQSLANPNTTNPHIRTIQEVLHTLQLKTTVAIFWTKGHSGVTGNEHVDKMAKEAAKRSEIDFQVPISLSTIKYHLRLQMLGLWQEEWSQGTTGRTTFSFIPTVSITTSPGDHLLSQILTGHGRFPAYFNRINKLPTATCSCGSSYGDVNHYLLHCPLTAELRTNLWRGFSHPDLSQLDLDDHKTKDLLRKIVQASYLHLPSSVQ